jgi:hypothetical protein
MTPSRVANLARRMLAKWSDDRGSSAGYDASRRMRRIVSDKAGWPERWLSPTGIFRSSMFKNALLSCGSRWRTTEAVQKQECRRGQCLRTIARYPLASVWRRFAMWQCEPLHSRPSARARRDHRPAAPA